MINQLLNQFLGPAKASPQAGQKQFIASTPATQALAAQNAISPVNASNSKGYNPFMAALQTDSAVYREVYGKNQPLKTPMFMGYRDNKALYGGSRLFILY